MTLQNSIKTNLNRFVCIANKNYGDYSRYDMRPGSMMDNVNPNRIDYQGYSTQTRTPLPKQNRKSVAATGRFSLPLACTFYPSARKRARRHKLNKMYQQMHMY